MLKQKARLKWTIEGDENSKFFHNSIRRKNSKCNFRGLNINGLWIEDPAVVKDAIYDHFKNLFSTQSQSRPRLLPESSIGPNPPYWSATGQAVIFTRAVGVGPVGCQPTGPSITVPDSISYASVDIASSCDVNPLIPDIFKLSEAQNDELEAQFSDDEIWEAVKGEDLIEAISSFWRSGVISPGCNSSFITLIPKVANPVSLIEYRPISLIRSFYKIITKLLSNRIKKVVPNLVGFEQSAFIKGRNILDGVLVANESLKFLKSKHIKSMLFKVDFEKAFDSLNWDFFWMK
ncbi:uncharacterized protein [Rutidosis leptorrhynchoides]|uniref:uncharacterized protein n=1 Tax=Rutidosis leptorrhynchoides TaxID=125765 RepID=UPI003A9A2EA2